MGSGASEPRASRRPRQASGIVSPHLGACQNYGPFLGTLNNRCRIIIGTQTGTIILTITHLHDVTTRRIRGLSNSRLLGSGHT